MATLTSYFCRRVTTLKDIIAKVWLHFTATLLPKAGDSIALKNIDAKVWLHLDATLQLKTVNC